MILDESLFEEVKKGEIRGPYKKKDKSKLSYNKIYDELDNLGYRVRSSDKKDNCVMVSKRNEKNLRKAKEYCDEVGLKYNQRFSDIQKRYYLDIELPEGLKEDLILDPTEDDKKLLNDLLDKYKDTKYEKLLDQLKSKYEYEDTFGGKEDVEEDLTDKALQDLEDKDKNYELDKQADREAKVELAKQDIIKEDLSQEEQQEFGLNTLINELIKSEYDAIDEYNSAIVTLEAENQGEYTDVIRSIIEDERHHIGNLQEIMNRITPGTEQEFEKGKEEAEQTLSEEPKEEVETIKNVELEDSALQA